MNMNKKKEEFSLTLVDAIETLSSIADLKFDSEMGVAEPHHITLNDKELSYRTVHWFNESKADVTVNVVKETFRVILTYLKSFYKDKNSQVINSQSIEGLKTIMILVGEAARKLDKYTTLFHQSQGHSVMELKEYKQLQEFYLRNIAKKIDEGTISKWILALARKEISRGVGLKGKKSSLTKHIFIDLDSVKKDSEYELFFLKKEDGTRFFSPRLIRNIKLISDFGNLWEKERDGYPIIEIGWLDESAYNCAKNIMRAMRRQIEKFYKTIAPISRAKENYLVNYVNKSLIALMMAAHPVHEQLIGFKNNAGYFHDFLFFLRRALQSTEYQRLMAYPSNQSGRSLQPVVSLIQFLCLAIYTQLGNHQELSTKIHDLIELSKQYLSADHKEAFKDERLWTKLSGNYAALSKLLKMHASGPLNKILSMLEDGEYRDYDPLLQGNLPSQLYSLYLQNDRIQFGRLPSPTNQEFIHKANINDEFKAFLYGCSHEQLINKILIFNFQDKTTWRGQARSKMIEDLPNHESFAKHLEVVTLDKETDFYDQVGPYTQKNHAQDFIKDLKQQLLIRDSNYGFPISIKKELERFLPELIETIHRVFFSNKNTLTRENRLDFIEIFYLFLQLKIIEILKPDVVGFSCKDGLDITCAAAAELFIFLKCINQEHLSENDQEQLNLMLWGPCLMMRERIMLPNRFNRMVSAIKAIESTRDQVGKMAFPKMIQDVFGYLYRSPILNGKVVIQNNKDIF